MVESSRYQVRHFPFPIRKDSAELADSEWAQMTTGLDSKGVRKFLALRWPVPADPSLVLLREKFLTYRPIGITTYDLRDYVQLAHPKVKGEPDEAGDSYFVAIPVPREEVEAAINSSVLQRGANGFITPALIEFFSLFPHLREDFETCGHFIPPAEWKTLAEKKEIIVDILEEVGAWRDALWIYHARNGDGIVLSHAGEVAWYCLSGNEIVPIADTFSSFLQYLTDYLDKRWPLESFGPSSGRRPGGWLSWICGWIR